MRWTRPLVFAAVVISASSAFGHAYMTAPTPRSTNDGIKTGPCGSYAKVNPPPNKFTSGQKLTVSWTETISHPGYYEIRYSPGSPSQDAANSFVTLQTNILNPGGKQATQSFEVTLPSITCTNCTLQLIQWMTESNPPTPYFACADFSLTPATDAGTGGGSGTDAGTGGGGGGGVDAGTGGGGAGGGAGGGSAGGAGGGEAGGAGGGEVIFVPLEDGGTSTSPFRNDPPQATGGLGCTATGFAPGLLATLLLARALRRRSKP